MGADDWLQVVRGGWGGRALGVAVKDDSTRGHGNVPHLHVAVLVVMLHSGHHWGALGRDPRDPLCSLLYLHVNLQLYQSLIKKQNQGSPLQIHSHSHALAQTKLHPAHRS